MEPSKNAPFKQVIAMEVFCRTPKSPGLSTQALYRFGEYCIDLQTEELGSRRTSVIGQILLESECEPALPVELVLRKRILRQTTCNSLGEFVMDYSNHRRLRLRFTLPAKGLCIAVPLPDAATEED